MIDNILKIILQPAWLCSPIVQNVHFPSSTRKGLEVEIEWKILSRLSLRLNAQCNWELRATRKKIVSIYGIFMGIMYMLWLDLAEITLLIIVHVQSRPDPGYLSILQRACCHCYSLFAMDGFIGTWKFEKCDQFEEYLKALGISAPLRKLALLTSPTVTIKQTAPGHSSHKNV